MQWRELTLRCSTLAAEAVAAILQEVAGGFASQDTPESLILWAWLPEDQRLAERVQALGSRLDALPEELLEEGRPELSARTVDDEDWAEAWKAYWHPTRVGQRLVIKPTWRSWPPTDQPDAARSDDIMIELDPGMAFGTGAHATTTLCLEALESTIRCGAKVIDLGCGSGILSIAALKLGAAEALAIDNDPLATQATADNCDRNDVAGCRVLLQDSLDGVAPGWDIIVANISLPIVTAVAPRVAELLRPGGRFICSGFYAQRQEELAAALRAAGLTVESLHERESWGCMTARSALGTR